MRGKPPRQRDYVDGGQHAESLEARQRDSRLRPLRYRVIRIWDYEVIENLREFSQGSCPSPLTLRSPRIPG
jgi:hypothetical protein